MLRITKIILSTFIALIIPVVAFASILGVQQGGTADQSFPVDALILGNGIQPLGYTYNPTVGFVIATSTTASIFPYASSTAITTTFLCLLTDCRNSWPSSGGTGTVSTSTHEIAGNLAYWTSNSGTPALLGQVSTTSATCTGTTSCSQFTVIGSSPVTITGGSGGGTSKWATTTNGTGIYPNGGTNISVIIGRIATTTNSLLEVNGTTTALIFNATSTTATSTFSGNIQIANTFSLGGLFVDNGFPIYDSTGTYYHNNGFPFVDNTGNIDSYNGTTIADAAGVLYYPSGNPLISSGGQLFTGTPGSSGTPSLEFNGGGGGTGLWSPGLDTIAFSTANFERVRLTSTGKFGIGTSSPWRTFSVTGSSDLGNNALAGNFTATSSVASTFPYASTTMITATTASTTNLVISGIAGTNCLHSINGVVSGTGSDCGSGSGTVTSISLGGGLDGPSPITTSGTITAQVGTSSVPTVGQIAQWTGNTTPSTLGSVATSTFFGASTNGFIVAMVNGSLQMVATSSINNGVTSVGTGNGLTGGTITTTGTVSINSIGLTNNALVTWNGSNFVSTGTPALYAGYFVATSTTSSILPYASTTAVTATTASSTNLIVSSITGSVQCVRASVVGVLTGTGSDCGSGSGSTFGKSWEMFGNPAYLAPTTTIGIIVNAASSTITNLVMINSTTTNATTTTSSITNATTTNLTVSSITGSVQCVRASAIGVLTGTGSDCGSSGGSGTVNAGVSGQVTFYNANGTTVSGTSTLVFGTTTKDANNIGIGTTSPFASLSLVGALNQKYPIFAVATSSTSQSPVFQIASTSETTVTGAVSSPYFVSALICGISSVQMCSPQATKIQGNYLYAVGNANGGQGILEIYDITDPTLPKVVGSFVDRSGGLIFGTPLTLDVKGNYAYVSGSNNITILDVSNPSKPVIKSIMENGIDGATLSNPKQVLVSGNYMYVIGDSLALEVADVSNPAVPTHVSSLALTGGTPNSIYIQGSYAYITMDTSFIIIDISNPFNPLVTGTINNGGSTLLNGPNDSVVRGRYAYIPVNSSNALEIIDVSSTTLPTHVASLADGSGGALLTGPVHLVLAGNYAYISSINSNAIEVVDISKATNPRHFSSISNGQGGALLSAPNALSLKGNYLSVTSVGSSATNIIAIGGEFISNEEVGGSKITNLDVTNNANFAQDLLVAGSLIVGKSTLINGQLGISNAMSSTSLSQVPTLNISTADTNTSSLVDILNITHTATSSQPGDSNLGRNDSGPLPGNNIAAGLLFSNEDDSRQTTTTSRIASVMTAVSSTSPVSNLQFWNKKTAGSLTQLMTLDQNGNLNLNLSTSCFQVNGTCIITGTSNPVDFGATSTVALNSTIQATSPGIVTAYGSRSGTQCYLTGFTDANNPPTTMIASSTSVASNLFWTSISFPVKKNNFYRVNAGNCVNSGGDFTPLTGGGSQWTTGTNGISFTSGNVGVGSTTPFAKFTIHAFNGNTNGILFQIASSTQTATTTLFAVDNVGHQMSSSTAPILSSCGTGPSLDGDDSAGTITIGSVASGCTLTFANTWAKTPHCVISNQSMSVVNALTYTESTTAIVISMTGAGGDKIDYFCRMTRSP